MSASHPRRGLGAGLAIAAGHDLGELEVALRIAGP